MARGHSRLHPGPRWTSHGCYFPRGMIADCVRALERCCRWWTIELQFPIDDCDEYGGPNRTGDLQNRRRVPMDGTKSWILILPCWRRRMVEVPISDGPQRLQNTAIAMTGPARPW
jgi:hypothetical protein